MAKLMVVSGLVGMLLLSACGVAIDWGGATPTPPGPAATPYPKWAFNDCSLYDEVDVRDLSKAPGRYEGECVQLWGEVFNIREEGGATEFQIMVLVPGGRNYDRLPVVVVYAGMLPKVQKGGTVEVRGRSAGAATGTNAFGGTVTQPLILADKVGQ